MTPERSGRVSSVTSDNGQWGVSVPILRMQSLRILPVSRCSRQLESVNTSGFRGTAVATQGIEHSKFQETERVINPMAGDSEVLTVKEVCELLRVHPSTVYKLLRQGKLPCFRVGSEWRFRKDLVMSWMAQSSMEAQQMRRVIETGVNGGSRH